MKISNRPLSGPLTVMLVILSLVLVSISIVNGSNGYDNEPTRTNGNEKGSVHEFNLQTSDMDNLTMEEESIVLSSLEGRVSDDFDDLSGMDDMRNLVHDERNMELDHDFKRTYGMSNYETLFRTIQTSDGGYASIGATNSVPMVQSVDLWLLKTDALGNEIWNRTFGGSMNDEGRGLCEASNGDLILVGYSVSYGSRNLDPWMIRTDRHGNEIWNFTYSLGECEYGMSVVEMSSGDIAACGYRLNQSMSSPTKDAFIIITESTGEEKYNRTWETPGDEVARDLIESSDGNLILIGDSEPFNGIEEITIWKLDTNGKELFNFSIGGRSWYMGYRILEDSSNDLYLFGLVMSMPGTGLDYILIKTDSSGTEIWRKIFNSGGNDNPQGMSMDQSGITLTGYASGTGFSEAYIVRTDLGGTEIWSTQYGGNGGDAIGVDTLPGPFGFYVFGHSYAWGPGGSGAFILNITSAGDGAPGKFQSKNMLGGVVFDSLKEITYTCGFTSDCSIGISFSPDGIQWQDANGNANQQTPLSSGSGKVNLGNLEGFTDSFYYRLNFECSKGDPGRFGSLAVVYNYRAPSGSLITYPLEIEEGVIWKNIGVDVDTPEGTLVKVQLRSTTSSEWNLTKDFTGPDGTGSTYYEDGDPLDLSDDNVVQLKVLLSSETPGLTPVINAVNVSYDIPGIILATNLSYNSGDIDDVFNFTLTFSDRDGDIPDLVEIEVDDNILETMMELDPLDQDAVDGKVYYYHGSYSMGNHTYSFKVLYGETELTTLDFLFTVLPGPLSFIEIEPSEAEITADEVIKFSAFGFDRDGNMVDIDVSWEASGGGQMDFGLFDAVKTGTWQINASSLGIKGSANVTVTHGDLTSIKVVTEVYDITADESHQLSAIGYDSEMNIVEIDPEWSVEGGGTIDQDGVFQGDKVGFWKIFANVSGITDYEIMEVSPGNLSSIVITPSETTVDLYDSAQFSAEGFDSNGNHVSIDPSWSAEAGSILSTGFYTADTSGTWKIYCNDSGISGEAVITVNGTGIIDDDDDDDDDSSGDDDSTSEKGGISVMVIAAVVAVVLLIIIAVVIVIVMKRGGKKEEEEDPPEVKDEAEELYGDLGSVIDEVQQEPAQGEMTPADEQVISPETDPNVIPDLQQGQDEMLGDMKLPGDYEEVTEGEENIIDPSESGA